jgi:hypothetical protein
MPARALRQMYGPLSFASLVPATGHVISSVAHTPLRTLGTQSTFIIVPVSQ